MVHILINIIKPNNGESSSKGTKRKREYVHISNFAKPLVIETENITSSQYRDYEFHFSSSTQELLSQPDVYLRWLKRHAPSPEPESTPLLNQDAQAPNNSELKKRRRTPCLHHRTIKI